MQENQKKQYDKLLKDLFNSTATSRTTHVSPKLRENLDWANKHKGKDEDASLFFSKEENIIKRMSELKALGADLQVVALKSSYMNKPKVTQYLIDQGVDFNVMNKLGNRLITIPMKNNVKGVVDVLIKNNIIDIYFKDPQFNDEQLLHQLLRYSHVKSAQHILKLDPQLLYSKDKFNNSFLYFAFIGMNTAKTRSQKIDLHDFIVEKINTDLDFVYENRKDIPLKFQDIYLKLTIEKYFKKLDQSLAIQSTHTETKKTKKI